MNDFFKHITPGLFGIFLTTCGAPPPEMLGIQNGRLAPCPDTPNCVSSYSESPQHYIEPLPSTGQVEQDLARLAELIQGLPRTKIAARTPGYLHAEFTIALFGFTDDVELQADEENACIHVRSASRTGRWDLGVNRRRVKKLRKKWLKTISE